MRKILVAMGFAAAYLVALELAYDYDPTVANRPAFFWLGSILGVLCLVTFVTAGSRKIVFTSVLSYGHLILIAAPAIYIGLGGGQLRSYLAPASAIIFLSLFFMVQIGLFVLSPAVPKTASRNFSVDGSLQILALALLALSLVAARIGGSAYVFETVVLAAVALSALVTFTRATIGRATLHALCLLLIIGVYSIYLFSGYGRLELASYVLCIGIVVSWVQNSYWPKIATIAATAPAYLLLTLKRIEVVAERYGSAISENDTLVSVFGPFQSGAYILQQTFAGEITPTYGQSWMTSFLFWVPRSIWSEKPPGFGRAIVPVTQPQNVQVSHHSDAAPYLAEFIWDFGMLGLLLIPVLVWLILRIDRWLSNDLLSADRRQGRRNPALLAACLAAVAGMLINFAWGGSFTFITRTAIPALLLLSLYLSSTRREFASTSPPEGAPHRQHLLEHRSFSSGRLSRAITEGPGSG